MIDYTEQPAFPPQVAQDNLGRIMAPIPGMTKLEFFALTLLPTYLRLCRDVDFAHKGKKLNAHEAAIESAKQLLTLLNKKENETDFKIVE